MLLLMIALVGQDGDFRDAASRTLIKLRAKVAPSVVAIWVERSADPEGKGMRGQRAEHVDYYSRPRGFCTGTIISSDGYVVTSAFNVSGEITKLLVRVGNDEPIEAKLLGYEKEKDLGVLKFTPVHPLPVLERADFKDVRAGDLAVIVGRAPDPENPTLNLGILSAMHRFGGTHLQTDAELNYGNVGGPLVDIQGRLVGITCQIRAKTHWGQSGGVGFAYRGDKLDALLDQLKKGLKTDKSKGPAKAFLGAVPAPGAEHPDGVVIGDVIQDSPADRAGMKIGDVLIELDGKPIKKAEELDAALKAKKPGNQVKIKIKRAGKKEGEIVEKEFTVKLDEEQEY